MIRILIAGYHGFGNCGDEATLLAMKNNIEKSDSNIHLTALSAKPEQTKSLYNIDAVQRFNIFNVLAAILKSDIILEGGGSLLQDETSTRSLVYYLSIIVLAKLFGKKVMLYSNGIGPVSKKLNRYMIKKVVNKVDLVTLREELSAQDIKQLKVTKPKTFITADPAFTLKGVNSISAKKLLENENIPLDKPIVGISIRHWKNSSRFIDNLAIVLDTAIQKYDVNILLIPMQYPKDLDITLILKDKMKNNAFVLRNKYTAEETLGIIGELYLILSMRLHALIFAAVQRIPMLGIIYDPKVLYYLKILNMPQAGDIRNEDLDITSINRQIDNLISDRQHYIDILDKVVSELINKANKNDTYLKELIKDVRKNRK